MGLRGPVGLKEHLIAPPNPRAPSNKENNAMSGLNWACPDPGPACRRAGEFLGADQPRPQAEGSALPCLNLP